MPQKFLHYGCCFSGLIVAAFAFSPLALAAVHENVSFSTYSAQAQAGKSIYETLFAVSPVKDGGKTFLGHTKWNVNWKFRWWREASGACKISSVDVNVVGKITLPELIGGDASQRAKFSAFLQNLRTHEMGHYQIGLNAGKEIERGILALPVHGNCRALEESANRYARQVLDAHKGADAQYDAQTKHGKTQGASLTD